MRINRSEEKQGIFRVIKSFINGLGKKHVAIMQVPFPDQFTRVTEKFDVVHRLVLQRVTK